MKKLLISICILFNSTILVAQINAAATEAKNHIGQVITVCDVIVDAKYLENSMTKPTLLNVGGAFPNHLLTIVINYGDRKNFPFNPEELYLNKRVCVTGTVSDFKGKPQIIALTPAAIKVDDSQARSTGSSPAGTPNRTASATQPNITTSPNRPANSTTPANNTNSSASTNRTNTITSADSANLTARPTTPTNPGNTVSTTGSGNQSSNTTGSNTSTSAGNRANTTGSGNQSNSTGAINPSNRSNTTNPTGSGNQSSSTSPTPSANTGITATPTGSTNRTGTANSTGSTGSANTTNRTSDADNSISSAYTIEIGPNLRVRSGPGETFPAIEVAKAGTEVTILESKNGWSRVSYERNSADQGKLITIEGYIKNSVLNSANTPTTTTTATNNSAKKTSSPDTKVTDDDNKKASGNSKNSDVYSIKISTSLRVRNEPSESSDVLEVIRAGTVVSVIRSANGWSYVSYPGNSSSSYAKSQTQKGYIKNSVLK